MAPRKEESEETEAALELGYTQGSRAAWMTILQEAMGHLGMQEKTLEELVLEREATVAALRDLCAEHGDNDWEPTAHLADVVSKHVYPGRG